MRSFKQSRFPNEALLNNVTLGPSEPGPDGPIAPLLVRTDHRIVDGYQLGKFLADIRRYLMEPERLEMMNDE